MLLPNEEIMMEKFESEYRKRFNFSMRQAIINEYQLEEYKRKRSQSLNSINLVGILNIVNQYIPLDIIDNNPTIATACRKHELVILRSIFISIAYLSRYSNKLIREILNVDRVTIIVQLKKMEHMVEYKDIYVKEFELYTTILAKIVSENERLIQGDFHPQSNSQSDLSFVLNSRPHYTAMD